MRFLHTSRLLLRLRASGNVFVCATPVTAPGSISGAPSSSQNGGAPPPPALRDPPANRGRFPRSRDGRRPIAARLSNRRPANGGPHLLSRKARARNGDFAPLRFAPRFYVSVSVFRSRARFCVGDRSVEFQIRMYVRFERRGKMLRRLSNAAFGI